MSYRSYCAITLIWIFPFQRLLYAEVMRKWLKGYEFPIITIPPSPPSLHSCFQLRVTWQRCLFTLWGRPGSMSRAGGHCSSSTTAAAAATATTTTANKQKKRHHEVEINRKKEKNWMKNWKLNQMKEMDNIKLHPLISSLPLPSACLTHTSTSSSSTGNGREAAGWGQLDHGYTTHGYNPTLRHRPIITPVVTETESVISKGCTYSRN